MALLKLMIQWQVMITKCAKICGEIYFQGLMKTEVLANLDTDSNKNLACSHVFNVSFNTTNLVRTTTLSKTL